MICEEGTYYSLASQYCRNMSTGAAKYTLHTSDAPRAQVQHEITGLTLATGTRYVDVSTQGMQVYQNK